MTPSRAFFTIGLAVAFLATTLMAASQMYAESPLAAGLPTRAIFHDWVYLVSRAAVIKHNWPLDDPSLSGTPLQYHYFMMVHAAAASATTGVELTVILLRLVMVPLGAVLVAQAYLLERGVTAVADMGIVPCFQQSLRRFQPACTCFILAITESASTQSICALARTWKISRICRARIATLVGHYQTRKIQAQSSTTKP